MDIQGEVITRVDAGESICNEEQVVSDRQNREETE